MGFDPKKYKNLFPLGLFEYENKPIETWFDSHRLFALNAIPQREEEKILAPGLVLKQGNIASSRGFSNYVIFEIDPKVRRIQIEFFGDKMFYPLTAFETLKNPKIITNAGYFYLTDDENRDPVAPPTVRTGNLVIEKGKLVNLPILDRSAIIILKDGSFDISFLKAKGKLFLNSEEHNWIGSKINREKGALIIYNSSNIEIPVVTDSVMGPSRVAKKTFIIPQKGNLFAICSRVDGKFKVTEVTSNEVMANDKDMIVEVPASLEIKKGDILTFQDIDGLRIENVFSAVSTGPMLFKDFAKTKAQVEKEFSVPDMANPNNPHEETKKLARGGLVKLANGKICAVLIDGIPQAGDIYPGVTLEEYENFIKSKYPNYESAVATDPSSSVKAVFEENGETKVFGNLHYLAHKKDEKGNISFWPNGKLGRKFNSALVVY